MRRLLLGLSPFILAAAFAAPAEAQSPAWHVSQVSGNVRIIENGRARAATRGALLSAGAAIATAADGRAVLVRGREYVVVSPRSQLRVPEQPERSGIIQMLSDWGTALFRIERRATPHFGVQTPYLAAVVKGTVFTVTVSPAGASVQVTEGAVEVSTVDGGAADMVRPGMIASVAASDLYQLHVDGETSRSIRSEGVHVPGVVTVPAPAQGAYSGPPAETPALSRPVAEDPVSFAESTHGLVGDATDARAFADVRDEQRAEQATQAGNPGQGGNPGGAGNGDNGGQDNGGGNGGTGSGSGGPGGPGGNGGPGGPGGNGGPGSGPGDNGGSGGPGSGPGDNGGNGGPGSGPGDNGGPGGDPGDNGAGSGSDHSGTGGSGDRGDGRDRGRDGGRPE